MTTAQTTGIRAIVFGPTRKIGEQVCLSKATPYWPDVDTPADRVVTFDAPSDIHKTTALIHYELHYYWMFGPFGCQLHVYIANGYLHIAKNYLEHVAAYARELPPDFQNNPNVYWLAEGLMHAYQTFLEGVAQSISKHKLRVKF